MAAASTAPAAGGPPRVIAVVVTYNRRDLLTEALSAVLGQTRAPDTVIVIDNASTDGTADAGPDPLPVRAAGRGAAQHRRRGRLRVRPGAGPGRAGRPGLADGRRHGAGAGRPAGHARRPCAPSRRPARADRQPGGVDGRPSASDEHSPDKTVGEQKGAGGGGGRGLPAHPLGVVRVDPGGRRPVPGAGPAAGRLLPVERRLRVHRPAAPRPGRPALPGQRRGAQDRHVRLDRRRPRAAVLLRGAEQGLDAAGRLLAGPRGAGAVRRRDAAPLGPHVRQVLRPGHAAVLPHLGPRGGSADQPAAHRGGAGVSGPGRARYPGDRCPGGRYPGGQCSGNQCSGNQCSGAAGPGSPPA